MPSKTGYDALQMLINQHALPVNYLAQTERFYAPLTLKLYQHHHQQGSSE